MSDDENIDRLKTAAELIREERRKYNRLLYDVVLGKHVIQDNSEDLMRLVGTLEAAYNHALASIASDGDIYCILKHLSYAIILIGELDYPDVESIYEIMAIVSNGKLEPCSSCKREENNDTNQNNKEDNA